MKHLILTLSVLFLISSICFAQAGSGEWNQVFSTGFDTKKEQAEWIQYDLGEENTSYVWVFDQNSPNSEPYCLGHWYPVGGMEITNHWMVSPLIQLDAGGRIDSLWSAFGGFGLPYNQDTVALYAFQGNQDPSLANNFQLIRLFTDTTYMNDQVWKKHENLEIPNITGDAYLAFRYQTIINWLDVKFDDLYVSKELFVGIEEQNYLANSVQLISNPVKNELRLKNDVLDEEVNATLINAKGQELNLFKLNTITTIDVSDLKSGIYFVNLKTKTANSVIKVIKQ